MISLCVLLPWQVQFETGQNQQPRHDGQIYTGVRVWIQLDNQEISSPAWLSWKDILFFSSCLCRQIWLPYAALLLVGFYSLACMGPAPRRDIPALGGLRSCRPFPLLQGQLYRFLLKRPQTLLAFSKTQLIFTDTNIFTKPNNLQINSNHCSQKFTSSPSTYTTCILKFPTKWLLCCDFHLHVDISF